MKKFLLKAVAESVDGRTDGDNIREKTSFFREPSKSLFGICDVIDGREGTVKGLEKELFHRN